MLVATALFTAALGLFPRTTRFARVAAVLGTLMSLALSLTFEAPQLANVMGTPIAWPQYLLWLGQPIYASDTLSAGMGAWCLLLGSLCLLKIGRERNSAFELAIATLTIAALYSLVHTIDLLIFAGHLLFLATLTWAYQASRQTENNNVAVERHILALGIGASTLLASTLLIGRTTGGAYSFTQLSLSALTVWPLVLIAAFVVLWLGAAPLTGWSAHRAGAGSNEALVQSLALGVPVLALLLRLQSLVSAQALAGMPMPTWEGFMLALSWVAAVTAIIAGAGTIVWAQTPRWTALLTAYWLGMTLWAVCQDTQPGRYAAIAMLLSYGASRVALELATDTLPTPHAASTARHLALGGALLSLAAIPLTAGFVGVWLLGAVLTQAGRPSLALVLLAATILNACGAAMHAARLYSPSTQTVSQNTGPDSLSAKWVALLASAVLFSGGIVPALWLPQIEAIANIAGAPPVSTAHSLAWLGLQWSGGTAPVLLLALGLLLLAATARLLTIWARSGVSISSTLLPTGIERLDNLRNAPDARLADRTPFALMRNPPVALWWLALTWLEAGAAWAGPTLHRLGAGAGDLLGRLEGRFYLPLALILTIMALIAITR